MSANQIIPMDASGEIQLLNLCAAGDPAAFELLVKQYQGLVCSLAYSAFGNQARSEDLAQKIFVAAWVKLKSLQDRTKFRSWLCGIARNLINQSIRQQGGDPLTSASTQCPATTPTSAYANESPPESHPAPGSVPADTILRNR
jgi:RNA polymerase sigma factor (sigma-70 family)